MIAFSDKEVSLTNKIYKASLFNFTSNQIIIVDIYYYELL